MRAVGPVRFSCQTAAVKISHNQSIYDQVLMRRWLTILLLVMMPLQLGWAALGSYCQHESGNQTKHFGHHVHQHQSQAGSEDDDGPDPQGGKNLHGDCNACVSAGVTPILSDAALFDVNSSSAGKTGFQAHPLSRPSSPPERPAWARLA